MIIRRKVVEVRKGKSTCEYSQKLITLECGHVIKEYYIAPSVGDYSDCPYCTEKETKWKVE